MGATDGAAAITRRQLLTMIGGATGSAVTHEAMGALGIADASDYSGPIQLQGDVKGTSVLVLGSGIAGLVAALELRNAGYTVQVLEFNARPGGRNWTLRGGDRYTELGGAMQHCEFDTGLYINPGPWRLPHTHYGIHDYCRRLGVQLEPFTQVNYNAYVHSATAFDGKPVRFREFQADYYGHVAELLAKATSQHQLDEAVTPQDQEVLLESLRAWGCLDKNMAYVPSVRTSERRGYDRNPGGGLSAAPELSKPLDAATLLRSRLWTSLPIGATTHFHSTIFQPVGGMDQISKAFAREVGSLITYNAKVVAVQQDARGVTATYEDTAHGGTRRQATADWCVCTIPLSVLSQIDLQVGLPMLDAINAVPYDPGIKIGVQFKRRFWEQDEQIYGGITYTDLPISQIGYPNTGYQSHGKGVLLAGYFFGAKAFEYTAMAPADRVKAAVEHGAKIHPQYHQEYENGISVAWHRVPGTLGCLGAWTHAAREAHYANLCAIDGRVVLAGEHASYNPGWQEGAVLSSLDAIGRIHQRVVSGSRT